MLDQRPDRIPQLDAGTGVEAGGRFVEQQDPGLADEARAEVELAPHTAGIGPDQPVGGLRETELGQDADRIGPGVPPALAEQPGDHLQVLPPGHRRLHGGVLARKADQAADDPRLLPDVVARHPELAAVGLHQGRHRPDERRLPGAVGTEDGKDLARFGDEVEPVQRQGLAEPLREAHCLDAWCHLSPL